MKKTLTTAAALMLVAGMVSVGMACPPGGCVDDFNDAYTHGSSITIASLVTQDQYQEQDWGAVGGTSPAGAAFIGGGGGVQYQHAQGNVNGTGIGVASDHQFENHRWHHLLQWVNTVSIHRQL